MSQAHRDYVWRDAGEKEQRGMRVPEVVVPKGGESSSCHQAVEALRDHINIVWLHATGMSSTQWFPNIGALSKAHRVYVFDIMGEPGKSLQEALLRNEEDCAGWIRQVLDGLGIQRAQIAGSSFGGWLTLNFALRAPERVVKAVLLSPAGTLLPFSAPVYLLLRLKPYIPIEPSPRRVLRMFFGDFPVHPDFAEQWALGIQHFRYANPRRSIFARPFSEEQLRSVQVPTLLLIGDRERIYDGRAALEQGRRLIPHLDWALVPDAGHILAMEQPDVVNRYILDFLDKATVAGA
jgi:pimeloyl-ACP methyl ester carboxylesterase